MVVGTCHESPTQIKLKLLAERDLLIGGERSTAPKFRFLVLPHVDNAAAHFANDAGVLALRVGNRFRRENGIADRDAERLESLEAFAAGPHVEETIHCDW